MEQQDALSEESASITLLGTGTSVGIPMIGCDCDVCLSPNPKNKRMRAGAVVQTPCGNFLIDTPPELRLQLVREKVAEVRAAVFTHSHADHIMGLDDLRVFGFRLDTDIPLFCEPIVEGQLRQSFNYAFSDKEPAHKYAVPRLTFREISEEPFELLGNKITPVRLMHGKLPILGFRIGNVAYCTDVSSIPARSRERLQGLDVLIIDTLREEPHPTHLSLDQALKIVTQLKPKRAVLTHISHILEHEATSARLPDGVEMGYDGLQIPISAVS